MKYITIIIAFLALAFFACNKDTSNTEKILIIQEPTVRQALYEQFKNGEISECHLDGQLVYSCIQNEYDAATVVFDKTGTVIGSCNYAWGKVDDMCDRIENCEVIYRCQNSITGEPFYDKYGLSR